METTGGSSQATIARPLLMLESVAGQPDAGMMLAYVGAQTTCSQEHKAATQLMARVA